MHRYHPSSEAFIRFMNSTIELVGDALHKKQQENFDAGRSTTVPDGRGCILSDMCAIPAFLISSGVEFTAPMAALGADIDNFRFSSKQLVDPERFDEMVRGWVEEDPDLWAAPSTYAYCLLAEVDAKEGTMHADHYLALPLGFARALLNADGMPLEQAVEIVNDMESYYATDLDVTEARKRYMHQASMHALYKVEDAIVDLLPPILTVLKTDEELRKHYANPRVFFGRSIITFSCFMTGLSKVITDQQLAVLRDIMVHYRMLAEQADLVELRTKLLNYLPNLPAIEIPDAVEILVKHDRQFRTDYANIARRMYLDLGARLVELERAQTGEAQNWLNKLANTMTAGMVANIPATQRGFESPSSSPAQMPSISSSPQITQAPSGNFTQEGPFGQSSTSYSSGSSAAAGDVSSSLADGGGEGDDDLRGVLSELDTLIGLDRVKKDVKELINFLKVQRLREEKGLPTAPISRHLVFYGNPGTGKTTVARILARIYKSLGVIEGGHLVEADRSKLVGQYVGSTAITVRDMVETALGGVLFIDEAYALVADERDTFGQEAVDTLLKLMEDKRERLIVIVAGYTDKMNKFLTTNPGLRSRFNRFFSFDDYDPNQLQMIMESFCRSSGFQLTPPARARLQALFNELYSKRDENFGNARDARNIFEKMISHQANRIVSLAVIDDAALSQLIPDDVPDLASIQGLR